MHGWVDEDVDRGVAVVGVRPVLTLDGANDRAAVVLDNQYMELIGIKVAGDLGVEIVALPKPRAWST